LLKRIIDYDPNTGEFQWKERDDVPPKVNTRHAGKVAGGAQKRNHTTYCGICISQKQYLAHRLAWLYMTGDWPSSEIDHRDCNGLNNRWNNLRLATPSQNGANKRARNGLKGVSFVKRISRFHAKIKFHGLTRHIGYFDTAEEAHAAYMAAAKDLQGEYARAA